MLKKTLMRLNIFVIKIYQKMNSATLGIVLIFFLLVSNKLDAQNYYVGVPVYDTIQIMTTNTMSNNVCAYGEASISAPQISQMPTGVNLYFKILSSQLSTGCLNITGHGIMNVGDSSLITTTNNQFEWSSLCGSGNMTYGLLAVGTPTSVGDSFYCSTQWTYALAPLVDGCVMYWEVDYYTIGSQFNCTVDSNITSSSNIFLKNNTSIYPNPFSNTTTLFLQNEIRNATFEMFNIYGQEVKHLQIINLETEISRENISDGLYFYNISVNNNILDRGKLIIE